MKRLLARVLAGTIAATALTTIATTSAANAATCPTGLTRFDASLDVAIDTDLGHESYGTVLGGIYAVPATDTNPTDYVASAPIGGNYGGISMCLTSGSYRFYFDITSPAYGHGTGWMHRHDELTDDGMVMIRKLVPDAADADVYSIDATHHSNYFVVDVPTIATMKDTLVALDRKKKANEAAAAAAQAAAAQAVAQAAAAAAVPSQPTVALAKVKYYGKISVPGAIKKTGTNKVGKTLKISIPLSATLFAKSHVQWYVGGKKIPGATKKSLVVKKAYRGKSITVQVTWTDTLPEILPLAPTTKKASFGKTK